jgi:hypothetical protein
VPPLTRQYFAFAHFSCYTSILATGDTTALVGYDVLNSVENIGYIMKVSVASA